MDPVALASSLEKYGGWGLSAVLMVVVAYLFRRLVDQHDAHLTDVRGSMAEATRCIANNNAALAANSGMDASIVASREKLVLTVEMLGKGIEANTDAVRELRQVALADGRGGRR